MPINRNNSVNVNIVDTPGSPQKRNSFLPQLPGKNGAVVVYDITNLESFLNAKNWIKLIQSKSDKNVIISLVGTKVDLVEG
jgi:Ras-related protein Rab-5C